MWDEAKLTPHVGHKVEITGTVQPPRDGTAVGCVPRGGAEAEGRLDQDGSGDLPVDRARDSQRPAA